MSLDYVQMGSVTLALEHRALAILAKKNANCLANSWLYFMNPYQSKRGRNKICREVEIDIRVNKDAIKCAAHIANYIFGKNKLQNSE